jgi:hypothetical protein
MPVMEDTKAVSPFEGLDYERRWGRARSPSTAAIGPLALDLCKLFAVSGRTGLAAAVLLDQGRVTEALELLSISEAGS